MNRIARYLFLALLIAAFVTSTARAQDCSLVTGDNYQPYSGKNLVNYGLASEIVERAFLDMGCKVGIEFLPWKRGYAQTLKGVFP